MPSDRVVVEFTVTAEIPNAEEIFDNILGALSTAVEDAAMEATNVYADIVNVEPIT